MKAHLLPFLFFIVPVAGATDPVDLYADTWVAVDALGRPVATAAETGPPRGDKTVGIFYYTWHGAHGYDEHFNPDREPDSYQGVLPKEEGVAYRSPYLIPEILEAPLGERPWGPEKAFHHWGEPIFGFYLSDDRWVIRRHAQMLADAGVDVLILDATNSFHYRETYMTLLDELAAMRAEGLRTPQVAFMTNQRPDLVPPALNGLWADLYRPGLYRDLWFEWDGKPLLLSNPEVMTEEQREFFTVRRSWAWSRNRNTGEPTGWFGDGKHAWTWVDDVPQGYGWDEDPSVPEQVSVSTAQHPTSNMGKSFRDGEPMMPPSPSEGIYFDAQWDSALETDPDFIYLTQWNEWTAMRFVNGEYRGIEFDMLAGMPVGEGDSVFVDGYDHEYNRDIEPMVGGFADNYYYQVVDGIRRFKGARQVPVASAPAEIPWGAGFGHWEEVGPEYRDSVGDTAHRDHPGWGRFERYENRTGRNDFRVAKVAHDAENLYFYAETAEPLTDPSGSGWMELFLAVDGQPGGTADWEGFDYRIRLEPRKKESYVVERSLGDFHWRGLGYADYEREGNRLQLRVPLDLLFPEDEAPPSFRFKWSDNRQTTSAIDWLLHGDTAPNARFQYVYRPR